MAAAQRRPRTRTSVERPVKGRGAAGSGSPKKATESAQKRRRWEAWKGRLFVVLVVVPMVLMLGSVYAHSVAARMSTETARLEEEKVRAEGEGERLEVKVTELSEPGRIRALAHKDLDMRDPGGADLETYGASDGEDVVNGGGEKKKETGE